MKKLLYTPLILFFLMSLNAGAQEFGGGLMAGIAATQVAGDSFSGFKKAGVYAGGFVNLQISPRSIFQLELEYFQKGARENPTKKNDYQSYLFRANYIEIPLLYQFVFNERVKMEAGPSFGVLVGYYEERNEEVISDKYDYNTPSTMTLQINVGIYVNITSQLAVNFRTNNSLLNIRTENVTGDVWRIWTYGQFHDSLVLSVFYNFKKKE